MHRILIVEDDLTIARTLASHLSQWGFETRYVTAFQLVMEEFVKFDPQMVLLDITLPHFNGYHWCSQIRNISKVPIIFISSASDNMNVVMAINMGADDFIAKPFDLPIVTAKIQALMRRTYDFKGAANVLQHKQVILNLNDTALLLGEKKLDLTKNEFRIMQVLMENAGKVVSRDTIMLKLWENDSFIDDNTLTVNVTRLRKKLEEIGLDDFITTKKGLGYIIE